VSGWTRAITPVCHALTGCRLTLDNTTGDHLLTLLFPATHTSYFGAIVDGVGILASPLQIEGMDLGSYEGASDSPTCLSHSNLYLTHYGGDGGHLAVLSFDTVQVPKPASWVLLAMGIGALLCARRLHGCFL
jgi:hypothetical protein